MSYSLLVVILGPIALGLAGMAAFLAYCAVRYGPIISRIFEEKPLFLPLRVPRLAGGEDVSFTTQDGLTLHGSYFRSTTGRRAGVVVFCHEYLSDRWSFQPYAQYLRSLGFDLFAFDFRNHGESDAEPNYKPLQWVTDHEVRDLKAALGYLRTRPDADPSGFGLFGISRGGGTALVVAAESADVWGVVTDGAFPTRGTMLAYIMRWAEIYVSNPRLWRVMPQWFFRFVAWSGRIRTERRLNLRYPDVERAASRITPRPWYMIHGQKDAYIVPSIAEALFAVAGEPKQKWLVAKAKHNRCREMEPVEYADRVAQFLRNAAPRPLEFGPVAEAAVAQTPGPVLEATLGEVSSSPSPSPTSSWVGELAAP